MLKNYTSIFAISIVLGSIFHGITRYLIAREETNQWRAKVEFQKEMTQQSRETTNQKELELKLKETELKLKQLEIDSLNGNQSVNKKEPNTAVQQAIPSTEFEDLTQV